MGVTLGDAIVYLRGDRTPLDRTQREAKRDTRAWTIAVGNLISGGITAAATTAAKTVLGIGKAGLQAALDAMPLEGIRTSFQGITGDEFTVAVLQGRALPSIRIVTPRVFYDYRAKYESDRTEYICRGTESDEEEAAYAEIAVAAFRELGCTGWGRVDFMTGADGQPLVLEVNTVPGMTSHSLVPMAAREDGIDFEELCWRILETSFAQEKNNGA